MEQYSVIGSVPDCKSGASGVGGSSHAIKHIELVGSQFKNLKRWEGGGVWLNTAVCKTAPTG